MAGHLQCAQIPGCRPALLLLSMEDIVPTGCTPPGCRTGRIGLKEIIEAGNVLYMDALLKMPDGMQATGSVWSEFEPGVRTFDIYVSGTVAN